MNPLKNPLHMAATTLNRLMVVNRIVFVSLCLSSYLCPPKLPLFFGVDGLGCGLVVLVVPLPNELLLPVLFVDGRVVPAPNVELLLLFFGRLVVVVVVVGRFTVPPLEPPNRLSLLLGCMRCPGRTVTGLRLVLSLAFPKERLSLIHI